MEGSSLSIITTFDARGTEAYRAPELLRARGVFNKKVDIWALGCVLYLASTGEAPFRTDYDAYNYEHGEYHRDLFGERWSRASGWLEIKAIVRSMLNPDISLRPGARDALDRFNVSSNLIPSELDVGDTPNEGQAVKGRMEEADRTVNLRCPHCWGEIGKEGHSQSCPFYG